MYQLTITTRDGATIQSKALTLSAAKNMFAEELKWESTVNVKVHDASGRLIAEDAGDYAFMS